MHFSTLLNSTLPSKKIATSLKVLQSPSILSPALKFRFGSQPFQKGRCRQSSSRDIKSNSKGLHTYTIRAQGPHNEEGAEHKQKLILQLENIPKDARALRIEEDTPSDTEWSLIGDHLTSVKDLEMDTGFNENLNDAKMPLHWPLEHLLISSACGEVFRTPFVLEGKAKHLILLLTSGLRFEGPTSNELSRANKEAIARGDAEPRYMTVHEGTPEERKIELVFLPELVAQWMREKYAGKDSASQPERPPKPDHINLDTLEILENDAIDAFSRMTLALPHLVENLKTLNIRSTSGLDFHFTSEEMFRQILPQLAELQTLVLSVGEVFNDESFLPTLYKDFPSNLSTLRFRGPVSLAKSRQWKEWVEAFASPDFLPHLEKLSFVLDLDYEKQADSSGRKKKIKAQEEPLREAKAACKELYGVAKARGVSVEPFYDGWTEGYKHFEQIDGRWNQL